MAIDIERGFRRLPNLAIVSGVFLSGGSIVLALVIKEVRRPLLIIVGVLSGFAAYFAVWGIFYFVRWIIQGFVGKISGTS